MESHTITHPDLTKVSSAQMQNEVCGTLDDYQTLFGRRPTLFRPPYGSTNANVQAVAASCGFKAIVLWKGSTNDGRFDLQDGTQLTPGDVVLMHFRTDLRDQPPEGVRRLQAAGLRHRQPGGLPPRLTGRARAAAQIRSGLIGAITSDGSSCQRSGCTSM